MHRHASHGGTAAAAARSYLCYFIIKLTLSMAPTDDVRRE